MSFLDIENNTDIIINNNLIYRVGIIKDVDHLQELGIVTQPFYFLIRISIKGEYYHSRSGLKLKRILIKNNTHLTFSINNIN